MLVIQTNRFKKAYKKLHSNQLVDINKAIKAVIEDFNIGEQKTGDLSWLRVYKFRMHGQLTLLGYSINNEREIILTRFVMPMLIS
jgi:mRNA-degrading endonuclease RelE of RelBE toxin-antitoxin system